MPPRLGMLPLATKPDSYIGYNRVVRFQASDGGFLLVESDGCLRKVPKEHESDPRTLMTLFSCDPHAAIGKKPKRVRSGDWMYLVQGSSVSLATEFGVTQADSDEMIDGPRHLVNEVSRHDAVAAQSIDTHRLQLQNSSTLSPHAPLSKQTIRKKQLDQAFTPEVEAMPTTVWCLAKVADTARSNDSRSPTGTADDDAYIRHGAQCHIFQNRFVVCYEKQSFSKGNEDMKRSVPETRSELSSRPSSAETSSPTRSSTSAFAHVWLQEVPRPLLSYHPASCQCSSSGSYDAGGEAMRRSLWDNTWRICDVSVKEGDRDASHSVPPDASRRSRQPNASAVYQSPQLATGSVDERSDEEKASHAENEDGDELNPEGSIPSTLHRQTSIFDVATFSAKAETQQARAARIIVRFFRRLFRDEMAQSRVQDFLRRRRRISHTRNQLVDSELTGKEQLKLLQCYNPHVYGSRQHLFPQHGKLAQQRPRRGISLHSVPPDATRQKLTSMKCGVDYLNQDWLRTEKHYVQKNSHEMYSRRPLSSPITPKRILRNRDREYQFLVEMKMAKRDPPSFHYGDVQGVRPHTAPLAAINSESPSEGVP